MLIEFLKKYPKYDGRGIKIAIIDSDVVDTSLPGLQKTTTGKPKIIECLGRPMIKIDTSKIVKKNGKNFIIGLTGHKLKIPTKWKNPSDEWHIGSKPIEELLFRNMELDCEGNKELETNKIEVAALKDKIVDCIVWFDGTKWRACIDTSLNPRFTNLETATVLTNFEEEHEIGYFLEKIPYCVNIVENGNALKIFLPYDDHPSQVTHVAAAYFPGNPEASGLAPGAQIISVHSFYCENLEQTVNYRLLKCIEYEVDIVNFSIVFELTPDRIQSIQKMVVEYGIIIIKGAGNYGPFYSSLPEQYFEVFEQMFFIGSMLTDDMKQKFHYNEATNQVHNFSSKGPFLSSGARGIDFVAPGSVITDLPKWYPNKNEHCHGTSLAAPNAAGSIACLLSALKANSISYSPAQIRMALANTALLPEGADKLSYGNGIIQICDAFEFIKKSINSLPKKLLTPTLKNDPKQKGIIYIKNDKILSKNYQINVNNFDPKRKWILKCTPNDKNFITHCKTITDKSFNVQIDFKELEEGSLNYAEINGFDSLNPSTGPLFYLPITVIFPADPKSFIDKNILLKPNPPTHFFIKCPAKSKECSIKITLMENKKGTILLTAENRQKNEKCWCAEHHFTQRHENMKFTAKKKSHTLLFNVENDKDLFQICFYHNFSSALEFKLEIEFQCTLNQNFCVAI
uniref:Peptidase S8/S53 domain-containing protein n=1 Tax=Panagrolaimus sp. ES5 TaxID=591445 RepID=A0AC34FGH4_9BILA